MGNKGSGRSFAEYLEGLPLAPDHSPKLILTGEVRRSSTPGKFSFSSPDSGNVELDVDAVLDFEPVDDGLTRITLDVASARRALVGPGVDSSGDRSLVPFVMATPHHASLASVRAQLKKAETSAALLDVETAFIKDVWGDEGTNLIKDVSSEETIPVDLIRF